MTPIDLYNNAVRAKEIIGVLARYGFGDILQRLPTPQGWLTKLVSEPNIGNQWQRLRSAIEELGPTFIKFGQILSTRTDVLPSELINELRQLTSQVSGHPFDEIEPILNQELKCPYQNIFDEFDTEPVACGSLGQVYKARLKSTNQLVSVKIQRPRLRRAIEADMEILGWLARQIHQRIEGLENYDLPGILEETAISILKELDFEMEGKNATLFNLNNPYTDEVLAPEVINEFTSKRVLVTEWIYGTTLSHARVDDETRMKLAEFGCRSVLHQIIESGFFHADPHAGNILVTVDNRLCFLDWGMVGQVTEKMRFHLADLFSAILNRNPEKIVTAALNMSKKDKRYNKDKLEKAVNLVLLNSGLLEGKYTNLGEAGIEILFCLSSEGVPLSRDYAILAKALYSIEKSGKELAPDFKIDTVAKPFVHKIIGQKANPIRLSKLLLENTMLTLQTLKDLPSDIQRVIRRVEEEDISINLYHKGLDHTRQTIRSSADHMALSIICAAFIVGSSLIVTTGMKPHLFGYPALGMVGFIISGVIGLWLMLDILWNRFKSRK